ncbi:MAG: hypothetical protein RLZ54_1010 [Candidatus Parcubacteria bacterium]|jgi:hypothetical protein
MSIRLLKKTIPFKWRVQSAIPKTNPTHVQMIAYVDARDVAEHLDTIVGAENWCDKYYEVKGNLFCSIGIKVNDEWIFKSDCGTESRTEKEKGESSDAFKRAAVKWGINRDAYRVGMIKLPCKLYNGQPYPTDSNGKFLKGQDLFDVCNKVAQVDLLENYNLEDDTQLTELKSLYGLKITKLDELQLTFIAETIENEITENYTKAIKLLESL